MQKKLSTPVMLLGVVAGSLIMALNINTFVSAGNLVPGGFNGLTVLIQRIFEFLLNIQVPFTVVNLALNAIPVYIGFRYVGKKFTMFSVFAILCSSFFVDILPHVEITRDPLLVSVFGGIINGIALSFLLRVGASSGGTDFIAMFISKKTNKSAWNYVLGFNTCIILISGAMFGWESALYSIIFQYVSTTVLSALYKRYQQMTLYIVTSHPVEVADIIYEVSRHGATQIEGEGSYSQQPKTMLYTVVDSNDVKVVVEKITEVDEKAFINVVKSEFIEGRFYQKPIE